jgi:hypothetical protein
LTGEGIIVGVNLTFDPTWLFLSLIPGGLGFVLMVYGKKQARWVHFLFGALFTVYPYFTEWPQRCSRVRAAAASARI